MICIHVMSCSVFLSICIDAQIFVNSALSLSPGVGLPIEVVEPLVELLDVRLLPLDVGAVLLEFSCHGVTAAFGQAQALLRLSDH